MRSELITRRTVQNGGGGDDDDDDDDGKDQTMNGCVNAAEKVYYSWDLRDDGCVQNDNNNLMKVDRLNEMESTGTTESISTWVEYTLAQVDVLHATCYMLHIHISHETRDIIDIERVSNMHRANLIPFDWEIFTQAKFLRTFSALLLFAMDLDVCLCLRAQIAS